MKKRAAVVLNAGNEILLLHRIRYGKEYWVIPGGSMEQGESLLECAIREIREELECEIQESQLVYLYELENQGREETYYWCEIEKRYFEISGEEAARSNQDNIYIPQWIQVEELPHINLKPEVLTEIILKRMQADK